MFHFRSKDKDRLLNDKHHLVDSEGLISQACDSLSQAYEKSHLNFLCTLTNCFVNSLCYK